MFILAIGIDIGNNQDSTEQYRAQQYYPYYYDYENGYRKSIQVYKQRRKSKKFANLTMKHLRNNKLRLLEQT